MDSKVRGPIEKWWLQTTLTLLWLLSAGGAMFGIWSYKLTPGQPAEMMEQWPPGAWITLSAERPTLILFAHPLCPCTRASLTELRLVLSRFGGELSTYVVFLGGEEELAEWRESDIWASVADLPLQVIADPEGEESHRFGAATSGHTVLYNPRGELLFAGGLTPGRGHTGDNAQLQNLMDRIATEISSTLQAGTAPHAGFVFGCALDDPGEER